MKRAAIGIRVHSGWGALVALSHSPGREEAIERSRVVVIDSETPGSAQPYHFAESMELAAAQNHVACCAARSTRLALQALQETILRLRESGFRVAGSAILLSSARPLPEFPRILASHPLIHTAEGEFFRQVFRGALEELQIPVTGIHVRDLDQRARGVFGKMFPQVCENIKTMGRSLGPPWTQDQKSAALAAAIVLAEGARSHTKLKLPLRTMNS